MGAHNALPLLLLFLAVLMAGADAALGDEGDDSWYTNIASGYDRAHGQGGGGEHVNAHALGVDSSDSDDDTIVTPATHGFGVGDPARPLQPLYASLPVQQPALQPVQQQPVQQQPVQQPTPAPLAQAAQAAKLYPLRPMHVEMLGRHINAGLVARVPLLAHSDDDKCFRRSRYVASPPGVGDVGKRADEVEVGENLAELVLSWAPCLAASSTSAKKVLHDFVTKHDALITRLLHNNHSPQECASLLEHDFPFDWGHLQTWTHNVLRPAFITTFPHVLARNRFTGKMEEIDVSLKAAAESRTGLHDLPRAQLITCNRWALTVLTFIRGLCAELPVSPVFVYTAPTTPVATPAQIPRGHTRPRDGDGDDHDDRGGVRRRLHTTTPAAATTAATTTPTSAGVDHVERVKYSEQRRACNPTAHAT